MIANTSDSRTSGSRTCDSRSCGRWSAIRALPAGFLILVSSAGLGAAQNQIPAAGTSGARELPALDYLTEPAIRDREPAASALPLRPGTALEVEPVAPLARPEGNPEGNSEGNGGADGNSSSGDPSARNGARPETAGTLGVAMQEMARRNPVVAVVEGEEIRWTDVLATARDLPPEYRASIESVFPALLDRLIDLKLLAGAGRAEGFGDDAELVRRVRAYEDVLIRDAYVAERITAEITEAEVRERYFEVLRAGTAGTERRLRHVVVDSREEALAVVRSLDAGLDFAELARGRSTGSSAGGGGDLGFLRRDDLEPAFAAAAFDLQVGSYSRTPLRTRFGWHVIQVESERKAVLPTYEELAPELREELARRRMNALLKKLRAEAELELFPDK